MTSESPTAPVTVEFIRSLDRRVRRVGEERLRARLVDAIASWRTRFDGPTDYFVTDLISKSRVQRFLDGLDVSFDLVAVPAVMAGNQPAELHLTFQIDKQGNARAAVTGEVVRSGPGLQSVGKSRGGPSVDAPSWYERSTATGALGAEPTGGLGRR